MGVRFVAGVQGGERISYYSDPQVLQASYESSNKAKGAGSNWDASSDPVRLPSNAAWRCDYMAKHAYIKHKYDLTLSRGEKIQTATLLSHCAVS